jgi:ferredoxin--NADP+ reductase
LKVRRLGQRSRRDGKAVMADGDGFLMANHEASGKQVALVIGGAVAGSEAVAQLTQQGILTIVMEQNPRPYGKIEDGLPRWHVKLRRQEYDKIDAKLANPNVRFIPLTKLGRDITWERSWGGN